jgi:hypothetical protein
MQAAFRAPSASPVAVTAVGGRRWAMRSLDWLDGPQIIQESHLIGSLPLLLSAHRPAAIIRKLRHCSNPNTHQHSSSMRRGPAPPPAAASASPAAAAFTHAADAAAVAALLALPFPPVASLIGCEAGSFAQDTITQRLPAIMDTVLADLRQQVSVASCPTQRPERPRGNWRLAGAAAVPSSTRAASTLNPAPTPSFITHAIWALLDPTGRGVWRPAAAGAAAAAGSSSGGCEADPSRHARCVRAFHCRRGVCDTAPGCCCCGL